MQRRFYQEKVMTAVLLCVPRPFSKIGPAGAESLPDNEEESLEELKVQRGANEMEVLISV